jgi:transposase
LWKILKTAEQLDLQSLYRVRYRLIGERTAAVNEIRAFLLVRGIAAATGIQRLRKALPGILPTHTDVLSPRMTCGHHRVGRRDERRTPHQPNATTAHRRRRNLRQFIINLYAAACP